MAVLYAFKSRQFKNKKYVYLYFAFYFITTTVILRREALAATGRWGRRTSDG
jgi:hypothetical protein